MHECVDQLGSFVKLRLLSNLRLSKPWSGLGVRIALDCNNKRTRGHLAKLSKPRCQKDVRKYFFSHREINRWNICPGWGDCFIKQH